MWLSWISHGYHVTDMYSESGELEQLELVESSENSSLRSFEVCMCEGCICDIISKRDIFLQNNFDQMLTFDHSSFHHFVQEVNEIWYLRRLILALPGYQMSLAES